MCKTYNLASVIQKDHHVLGTILKTQLVHTSDLGLGTVHKLFQAVYLFLHALLDPYGFLSRRLVFNAYLSNLDDVNKN